jgi:hypothetical protein
VGAGVEQEARRYLVRGFGEGVKRTENPPSKVAEASQLLVTTPGEPIGEPAWDERGREVMKMDVLFHKKRRKFVRKNIKVMRFACKCLY